VNPLKKVDTKICRIPYQNARLVFFKEFITLWGDVALEKLFGVPLVEAGFVFKLNIGTFWGDTFHGWSDGRSCYGRCLD
jgi:hypothetical protein